MPKSATHVPALTVTHVPAPFTKGCQLAPFHQRLRFPAFPSKSAKGCHFCVPVHATGLFGCGVNRGVSDFVHDFTKSRVGV